MKLTNVLLLNMNPSRELSDKLRGIIESIHDTTCDVNRGARGDANWRLRLETIDDQGQSSRPEGGLLERVSRYGPAVIFLVSSWNYLKQAKSLFSSLRGLPPAAPVVVVSDADLPNEMFELIELGAADYITPPLKSIEIIPRLWKLLANKGVDGSEEPSSGSAPPSLPRTSRPLIGSSPAFLKAVSKIPQLARCGAGIFITGETGVGKEVCAHAIHELGPRARGPFQAVNCGAIPVELVENELFGHERGAYTNAAAAQEGLIQSADGGTLFLDEIDSLPLLAQVKLLRFLQEKEYKPLGSSRTRRADVQIIAASNINIEKAVSEGKFRQDLYYRLNVIPLSLPPLRQRREDIPLLANHFLAQYAIRFNKPITGFSAPALQKLTAHGWPGNVRELENAVARAVALCEGSIIDHKEILPVQEIAPVDRRSFREMKADAVTEFERAHLQGLLVAYRGNVTRAAVAAQENRRSFTRLLSKYGIKADDYRGEDK
jgi:DNA-binding NtrC family response regulator